MKKECTSDEARVKAEAYCAVSEHCKDEVFRKLEQWGAPADSFEPIIQHLEEENYLDEQRYAIAFVRDKYRFNQWGKMKISQALKLKHVPSGCISRAMQEIDEEEYRVILASLLRKKRQGIKANNEYERNGKLIRFAIGHGYEMDEILRCIQQMGFDDGDME